MSSSKTPLSASLRWLFLLTALIALLALWRTWRVRRGVPVHTREATCLHWVGIRGEVQRPTARCLHRKGNVPLSSKQWRQAVKNAGLRCQLTALLPRPGHGQVLFIRGTKRCTLFVYWMSARKRILLGMKLPLNKVSIKDLQAVPRLSRKVAKRMVEFRRKHGVIRSWQSLLQVRGIGEKSLRRFQRYLRLDVEDVSAAKKATAPTPRQFSPPTRRHSSPDPGVAPSVRSRP